MIPPDATFDGTFPFAPHLTNAPGFRMHYVDEGPRDGEIVLCLHSEPTWGYLFRHLVATLRRKYRVVVPDHMGFGKSETPAGRSYWLQDHVANLEAFVAALGLTGITLVMHDFGGPVGMGFATRHPDNIRRIISANGPTPFGQPDLFDRLAANAAVSPWFQWIGKAWADGTLEPVLNNLDFNILSTLKLNGFENNAVITDAWMSALRFGQTRQGKSMRPGSRDGCRRFVQSIIWRSCISTFATSGKPSSPPARSRISTISMPRPNCGAAPRPRIGSARRTGR